MLRDKMLQLIAEVNEEVVEREELIEMIAIALLTRNNLFILGKPGQAKSHSINLFRQRIIGARQFERLLSKQTDEDQLFGRIDLSSLIPGSVPNTVLEQDEVYENQKFNLKLLVDSIGGMKDTPEVWEKLREATGKVETYRAALAALNGNEPEVQTKGKIPEADIVFLDECFKANDGVLNSLLTALNERKYTNEGRTYQIPTISFFAASNEIPNFNDPQEKILEALYDRLQIKVVTEDIIEREKRLNVLKSKQSGSKRKAQATITLDELIEMQKEVAAVTVPDSINELADDILCELRRSGITVSDRKYLNYYPLAQAKAWMEDHDEVMPQDMMVLKCYLWQLPGDRVVVQSVLNRLCINPIQDKVNKLLVMAAEVKDEFDAAKTNAEKPNVVNKALIKLRGELIRLYRMQQDIFASAQTENEKSMTESALNELERISKSAHESAGFTYAPLEQLAALQ